MSISLAPAKLFIVPLSKSLDHGLPGQGRTLPWRPLRLGPRDGIQTSIVGVIPAVDIDRWLLH